jgi:hypothetical protein
MMGIIALCCTAEGLSNPTLFLDNTIAVDASEEFFFEFHGLESGVYFELLAGLDLHVALILQFLGFLAPREGVFIVFLNHVIFQL